MKYPLLAVALSASAAFAAATWVYQSSETGAALDNGSFDESLPAADRIAALERAVSDERMARQLLQEEVFFLTAELEAMKEEGTPVSERRATEAEESDSRTAMMEERRRMYERRNSPEGQVDRLIEAGFLPAEAEWIVEREQQLQMEALQARYDAGRNGEPSDFFRDRVSASNQLREELGDADYERYLEANGRSTSVEVSSVIGNSPAQSAGLLPGDEIVRYDGERVFSMTDITVTSMAGEPGQNVVIDFMRDGQLMQVSIPRGPLGVTGGRRRN